MSKSALDRLKELSDLPVYWRLRQLVFERAGASATAERNEIDRAIVLCVANGISDLTCVKTLRDDFAAHALAGMLAHSRNGHGYRPRDPEQPWHEAIAQESYELADAMLAEREKEPEA